MDPTSSVEIPYTHLCVFHYRSELRIRMWYLLRLIHWFNHINKHLRDYPYLFTWWTHEVYFRKRFLCLMISLRRYVCPCTVHDRAWMSVIEIVEPSECGGHANPFHDHRFRMIICQPIILRTVLLHCNQNRAFEAAKEEFWVSTMLCFFNWVITWWNAQSLFLFHKNADLLAKTNPKSSDFNIVRLKTRNNITAGNSTFYYGSRQHQTAEEAWCLASSSFSMYLEPLENVSCSLWKSCSSLEENSSTSQSKSWVANICPLSMH